MQITNLHAIHVRYLGPTDTKGARVKLTSKRFNQSVTLNRDYSRDSFEATDYLASLGFSLVGTTDDGDIILTTTFEPLK